MPTPGDDGGTGSAPRQDPDRAKTQQENAAAPISPVTGYRTAGFSPQIVAAGMLPWTSAEAPLVDTGTHDATGVRMFSTAGKLWDHPVGQAQLGLQSLASYKTTGNKAFLDRAIANAQRNIDRRVVSRGAWFYPYDFDLTRCAGRPVLKAPWYSAMAQGEMLNLFVRLYEVTKNPQWKAAADRTFTSLTLAPDPVVPWVSWVDPKGYLWLEEYPVSGEVDAAATTVDYYVPTSFLVPGWKSYYSMECRIPANNYLRIHEEQMLKRHNLTRSKNFAKYAIRFRDDYPAYEVKASVAFAAAKHIGYRYDGDGRVLGSKTVTLSRSSLALADQRKRILGRGINYHITNGALAGYWIQESYPTTRMRAKAVQQTYSPTMNLSFAPGTYSAYAYDSAGALAGTKTVTLTRSSSAPLRSTAWVNGRFSYWVDAGCFKGYWLPHSVKLSIP